MNLAGVLTPQQSAQPLGFEDGQAVIYSTPNFYVRSAYRPGQPLAAIRRPTGHTKMMPKVLPQQGERVAHSETRMMPKVELSEDVQERRTVKLPVPRWLEMVILLLALAASFVAHAYNMFNYPRYELDEGTYMSSAWAIWNGMITPYAYGYGHPPLAWMQIAAGLPLVGGFFTFGTAINTGRVLMLFYAVGSSLLVYLIVRKLSESRSAALLAMITFSLSPLAVAFQRQVFLDNIGTFWMLLSLYFLVVGQSRLRYVVFSATALGIAFLSKEVFVLFIPVMLYGVWIYTTKFQRKFSMVAYTYTVISVCSAFVLMAILKGELFPQGFLPWDHTKHLSMIGTFTAQAKRGSNEGNVLVMWQAWMSGDFLLMIAAVAAPFANLFMGIWNRKQLFIALLAASFWLLLVRGGVVLSFYIIPLIPFIAINIAVGLNTILRSIARLFYVLLIP
jgi:4-amino-4-deoxy-L-arabinose transferase-like glycosyltransferase